MSGIQLGHGTPCRTHKEDRVDKDNDRLSLSPAAQLSEQLEEHGSQPNMRGSGIFKINSGIIQGSGFSTISNNRDFRRRDPNALAMEIMHLLDKLKDKCKQATLLTEYLTGNRSLLATDQELRTQLENNAVRDIKRHIAATKARANMPTSLQATPNRAAMETTVTEPLAQKSREISLAS